MKPSGARFARKMNRLVGDALLSGIKCATFIHGGGGIPPMLLGRHAVNMAHEMPNKNFTNRNECES